MLEEQKYHFFHTESLKKTQGIQSRATEKYLRMALEARFPEESFSDITVTYNASGKYQAKAGMLEKVFGAGRPVEGLPPYY
ncbi:MAG: hypothetical protein NC389_17485, partial [Acetatifactor muris]|nr:hypothetical protein [Acetatifactor muris]